LKGFFKNFGYSLFEYLITFLVFWLTATGVHEAFHLKVLRYFGGEGVIGYDIWGNGFVEILRRPPEPWQLFITTLAGGVGVAIVYFIMLLTDIKDDYESGYALIPLILVQGVYGVFEAFFIFDIPRETFFETAQLIAALCYTIGFLVSIILFVRKFVELHYPKV
jgi:hypothetical protein